VIGTLVLSAAFFRVDVGMGAFVGVVVLSLGRAADDEAAVRCMPWASS